MKKTNFKEKKLNFLSIPPKKKVTPNEWNRISHMAGSSQPQHFFAAGCVFADFASALIFCPVITNL